MDFDQSLARLNVSVGARLANASAQLDGQAVQVLFDNAYDTAMGIVGVLRPRAGLPSADAGAVAPGSVLAIDGGTTYSVAAVEPDGSGWTVLSLQEAA